MTRHVVVSKHGKRVRRFLVALSLAAVAFLLVADLPLLWQFSTWEECFGASNLLFLAVVAGIVGSGGLYRLRTLRGDGAKVAKLLGGTPVELAPQDAALARFRTVAAEAAEAAGIALPQLFVMARQENINAFAAGTLAEGTAVCVSAGALDRLDRNELLGVVAHEMAHLRHGDVAISRVLTAAVFGLRCFSLLGLWLLRMAGSAGGQKEGAAGGLLLGVVALCITLVGAAGWLASALLDASTSREMELRADADAARMLSDCSGLVGALVKIGIEASQLPVEAADEATAHNPMHFNASLKAYWFDSHPPLMARIRALDPKKAQELPWNMKG